jgi:hypothetical protein
VIVDSFSGPAAELPRGKRTPENVLAALRKRPRVSCFDMSEHYRWLPGCIEELKRRGAIKDVPADYPWCVYEVQAAPQADGAPK